MRYWLSPFPLPAASLDLLAKLGLQPWPTAKAPTSEEDCLLLYDSPDLLFLAAAEQGKSTMVTPQKIVQGYTTLLKWSQQMDHPLLAGWQLQQLDYDLLQKWLFAGEEESTRNIQEGGSQPPRIPTLLAAVTLCLAEIEPQLYDAYHDLELCANLFGRQPDLNYRQRLHQASDDEDSLVFSLSQFLEMPRRMQEFEQSRNEQHDKLKAALEGRKQSHIELVKTRQEMAEIVKADREKQQILHDQTREINDLKASKDSLQRSHQTELATLYQRFEPQLVNLEQNLAERGKELKNAQEENEQILRQLYQVQEELEAVFLADQEKQRQLDVRSRDLNILQQSYEALQGSHRAELDQFQQKLDARHLSHQQELSNLRQQMEPKLTDLSQRLATREGELEEAREELDLIVLQLHQVQKELEHYFLLARSAEQLAEAHAEQLQRAQRLLARFQGHGSQSFSQPSTLAVEILPAMGSVSAHAKSLQTEALLNTYAASLKRANDLLKRAKQP